MNQLVYWVYLEKYIEKFLIQLLVKQRQLDLLQSFTPAWDITIKQQLTLVTGPSCQSTPSFIVNHTKVHYISHFPVAVITCSDRDNLQKKEFICFYSKWVIRVWPGRHDKLQSHPNSPRSPLVSISSSTSLFPKLLQTASLTGNHSTNTGANVGHIYSRNNNI